MKKNISELENKLVQKEKKLSPRHRIVTPESGVSPEQQADWMIRLLQKIYTNHGIAKDRKKVEASILSGECRCWFVMEGDDPVAVTALINNPNGTVEIGRAVAITPGIGLGGVAILRAVSDHFQADDRPLVAETRVAAEFKGVPSGLATQKITFGEIGLQPNALVPMFNHGNPVRQEMFILSSSEAVPASEPMVVPRLENLGARLIQNLQALALIDAPQKLVEAEQDRGPVLVKMTQESPFAQIDPDPEGQELSVVETEAFRHSPFILVPVESSPQNTALVRACLDSGFIPCGIDRKPGADGHPVILFGKLKEGTLLAPIELLSSVIEPAKKAAFEEIDRQFRRKGEK
jgi:hypothetical protein